MIYIMSSLPINVLIRLLQLDMATLGAAAKIGDMIGDTGLAHNSETYYRKIVDLAFNLHTANANKEKNNNPGFDLYDKKKKILIQITSNGNWKQKTNLTKVQIEKLKECDHLKKYTTYIIFISEFSNLHEDYEKTKNVNNIEIYSQADILRKIESEPNPDENKIAEVETYLRKNIIHLRNSIISSPGPIKKEKPAHLTKDSKVFKDILVRLGIKSENYSDDNQLMQVLTDVNNFQDYWWEKPDQMKTVISTLYSLSTAGCEDNNYSPHFTYETINRLSDYVSRELHLLKRDIGSIIMNSDITTFYVEDENDTKFNNTEFNFYNYSDSQHKKLNGFIDLQCCFTQKSISKFLGSCNFDDLIMRQHATK